MKKNNFSAISVLSTICIFVALGTNMICAKRAAQQKAIMKDSSMADKKGHKHAPKTISTRERKFIEVSTSPKSKSALVQARQRPIG